LVSHCLLSQAHLTKTGQFRLIFLTKTLQQSRAVLDTVSKHALTGGPTSLLGRATLAANASYSAQPPVASPSDEFVRPERYTPLSGLFSFALMLRMAHDDVELADLPPLWRESPWTVYLDNVPHLDTRGLSCADKWLGGCGGSEVAVVVIRPDGYVGSVWRGRGTREHAARACASLDAYFEGFLDV
jgi:phenol 2-monooxygenase (NADPH)